MKPEALTERRKRAMVANALLCFIAERGRELDAYIAEHVMGYRWVRWGILGVLGWHYTSSNA